MIPQTAVYPFALVAAAFVAWRAVKRGRPAPQALARALLVLYVGWILSMTFFPMPVRAADIHHYRQISAANGHGFSYNVVPFRSIRQQVDYSSAFQKVRQLGGNVLVFTPFGLLLPLAIPRFGRWRRVLLTGLAFSLAIEFGQLVVSLVLGYTYRVTDIDDVILNLTGVLLGYGLLRLVSVMLLV